MKCGARGAPLASLLFLADAFEWLRIRFLIHELSGTFVPFGPTIIRGVVCLRAVADRAFALPIASGRVGGHASVLLSPASLDVKRLALDIR